MDSDSDSDRLQEYRDHAAGGGSASASFNMFSSTSSGTLPDQPAAYEDFEFPSPFDFDGLFSSSAPTGAAGPSATTGQGNPFSPPSHSPAYMATPSPAQAASPNPFPFTSSSAAARGDSLPHPPPPNPDSGSSLFDASESALFSSFLNTLDVDPNFLFNPVLPPGMPSPPPAIPHLQQSYRNGEATEARLNGWSQSTREVDVKPVIPRESRQEPQRLEPFEDEASEEEEVGAEDDTEGDPDFFEGSRASGRKGRRTRGGAQQVASGRGSKKARVQKVEEGEETVGEDGDVEMADTAGDETATPMGPPSTRRRTTRPAAARRPSVVAATRPSGRPARAASQRSPSFAIDADADGDEDLAAVDASPPIDRKAPLTETQKRSNHIQSEQKRRNAIRNGFKDLVDILSAGEAASGIVVAPPDAAEDEGASGKKKKSKGTGRGRGRKGEVGAGASKSVVLNKAAEYILWLERGNEGLEREVERVELALREAGLDA